jgi:hypothetical protein
MLEVLGARICQAMLWSVVGVLKLLSATFVPITYLIFAKNLIYFCMIIVSPRIEK